MTKRFSATAFLMAVLFNALMGSLLAMVAGADPATGAVAMNMVGVAAGYAGSNQATATNMAFSGLYREIWIKGVLRNIFYGSTAFMMRMRDYSSYVENEALNFSEITTVPEVYVNAQGPFNAVANTDGNYMVPLNTYDTQSTFLKNAKSKEKSYDEVVENVQSHRDELGNRQALDAIFEYAPTADTDKTPLISTTGAAVPGQNNRKKMTFADLIEMRRRCNVANLPQTGRVLVLHPDHEADLMEDNLQLYNTNFVANEDGLQGRIYGFDIYSSTLTPLYINGTTKKPVTALPTGAEFISSVLFIESLSLKAQGTMEFFQTQKQTDAVNRGDTIGFQNRFVAKPIRPVGYGAIVSLA